MDKVKAYFDRLLSIASEVDELKELDGFVYAAVEWQHMFSSDRDLTQDILDYVATLNRKPRAFKYHYDSVTQKQLVYVTMG